MTAALLGNGDALRERYLGTDPFDWIGDTEHLCMNMATYDLMGKELGVPAWKLIGPRVRSWMPVAAWTVSQEPQAMAEEVLQAAQRGYHWMKYHVAEIHNVIDQTRAMQEVAPPSFKVHYDFNANRDVYTMGPINGLTRQMAIDFGPLAITVNAIAPGHMVTENLEKLWADVGNEAGFHLHELQYPVRRTGESADVAHAVSYLCSPQYDAIWRRCLGCHM